MDNPTNKRTIVFVTFESDLARHGGLGAVMSILPKHMAQYESCFLLAPYFVNITDKNRIHPTNIKFVLSISETQEYEVEIWQKTDPKGFTTYLLAADGFFTALDNPYTNLLDSTKKFDPDENYNNITRLIEDAFFFCAAVPKALVKLGMTRNLILHLQDWETSCVVKAIKKEETIQSATCVLTLHNSYDIHVDTIGNSSLISEFVSYLSLHYSSILSQTISDISGPLSTVSKNFADELISDSLQTHVFAKHLQNDFITKGLFGIDNGVFEDLIFPFSDKAHRYAKQNDVREIQQEKWARRETLAHVMEEYQRDLNKAADPQKEAWGADLRLSDLALPVFLIPGRDDPRQKGFDVVAAAIEMIPRGKARYIFTPLPGDEGLAGLAFLKKLAEQCPGEVKVFPFRLDPAAYKTLREGSSFMVMSSLYEPFGAATEAYLAGMPVVARATGGLVQQVVPYPSASLSRHGRQVVAGFHSRSNAPTGFLFREPTVPSEAQDWQKIIACAYWHQNPRGDRLHDRKAIPLFDAMVQHAAWALQDAIDLYTSDQMAYATMIYSGFKMLDQFSWDRTVREYRHLYDLVGHKRPMESATRPAV